MPLIPIATVADPRIAVYRDLKSPESKRRSERFVVEGLLLTERLLGSGLRVASLLAEERMAEQLAAAVPADVPLYVVPRLFLRELAGFKFHRGVLGCGYRPHHRDLRTVFAESGPRGIVSVCVGLGDPENLGVIIRSSAAFGAAAVALGPNCADPFSRRVARTSMGTNLRLPIVEAADLEHCLADLRNEIGLRVVATVLDDNAVPLAEVRWPPRAAILFGSEGCGLPPQWRAVCDQHITIPMRSGVDSLNVSVAAGIFLYQATAGGILPP